MKGLEAFERARLDGRLLSRTVLLWIGRDGSQWWRWPETFVFANGRIDSAREDMRVLVGLDVILVADEYDHRAAAIYTRAKDFAASVIFVVLSAGDGLVWARGSEDRGI